MIQTLYSIYSIDRLVADVSSEKDESYWIGVRDALRMVDSFLRWSRRNPTIAKSLDEFLAEGLVAAAKRCESCLGRELGLKYGKEDPEKGMEDDAFDHKVPDSAVHDTSEESTSDLEHELAETNDEVLLEDMPMAPPSEEEIHDFDIPLSADATIDEGALVDALSDAISGEPVDDSAPAGETDDVEMPESSFIGNMEPEIQDRSIDELDYESEPSEFTSDFELTEPEPLIIEPEDRETEESTKVSPIEFEDPNFESAPTYEDDTSEQPEATEVTPSFEMTPPEIEDSELEEPAIRHEDVELASEPIAESDPQSALSSLAEIWSPYDEPSISDDELAVDEDELPLEPSPEEKTEEEEEVPPSPRRVPPPPPPPETDETEEERRKRARRLFFGA